jgi:RNA polymerase sigma factor (sigma-70 family)
MAAPAFSIQNQRAALLSDPTLRDGLQKYARRRLPPSEVEDLVQNTLTEALVAANAPSEQAEFRRWVHGIARHKIADSYRRRGRLPILSPDVDQNAAEPSPSTGELSQWIESELPKTDGAQATLHWLLREGDGETLDEIARDVDLPAPRVRQRVSRLRRHFHARWLALGAAGLLSLLGVGALFYKALQPAVVPPSIAQEPTTPLDRARVLRQNALQHCAAGAYPECIAALDQAKALDPSGESANAIREARDLAANAVQPKQIRNLPAGTPPTSAPDTKSTPKQRAPSKLEPKQLAPSKSQSSPEPKQLAPSKLLKKGEPLGANPQQNAPPSQQTLPSYDDLTGSQPAAKAASKPESKQRETMPSKGKK